MTWSYCCINFWFSSVTESFSFKVVTIVIYLTITKMIFLNVRWPFRSFCYVSRILPSIICNRLLPIICFIIVGVEILGFQCIYAVWLSTFAWPRLISKGTNIDRFQTLVRVAIEFQIGTVLFHSLWSHHSIVRLAWTAKCIVSPNLALELGLCIEATGIGQHTNCKSSLVISEHYQDRKSVV